jgi:hypothetical protein
MLIRNKQGEFTVRDTSVLLDFLGVKQEAAGPQKVAGDVELIASVPFRLAADNETAEGLAWTLSTFDLDRFGERIDPAGWDYKRYRDNPVVDWAHRYDIPAFSFSPVFHAALRLMEKTALWRLYTLCLRA